MREARSFVLLAVIGQLSCAGVSMPPIDTSGWKFSAGNPPLPDGLACLDWPMPKHQAISSTFRDPRHTFTPGKHTGIDFPAPASTEIRAPAAGIVTKIEPVTKNDGAGVYVRFGEGWTYSVYHLSHISVKEWQRVSAGDLLGLSGGAVGAPGSGPYTTGPHLHFSVSYEGAYVNPSAYLCP